MVGYKNGQDRQQGTFLPTRLDDYISEYHPCRVIDAFVDRLDLTARNFTHTKPQLVGSPAFAPGDMLKLFIYGYQNRVFSSRGLEKETQRNVEVMWLVKGLTPDARTICYFRAGNTEALKKVFRDFNKLCIHMGIMGGNTVSIDGSKMKADNAKRHHYTLKKIEDRLNKLDTKITEYLNAMEQNDQDERKEEPIDLSKASKILKRLNMRKEKLENILDEINENKGKSVCTIDEEASLMKQSGGKGFDVSYNVQTAVDEKHGLVAEFNVTNHSNDMCELGEMARRAKEMLGVEKLNVLADAGYCNGEEINACHTDGMTCYVPKPEPSHQPMDSKYKRSNFRYDTENNQYICPEGNAMPCVRTRRRDGFFVYANRQACMNCPNKSKCTKSRTLREIERSPYQTDIDKADENARQNRFLYRRRQELSEHPFGVVKRKWGYCQFLCRGMEKVSSETALLFLAFNFKRALNILGPEKMLECLASFFLFSVNRLVMCFLDV